MEIVIENPSESAAVESAAAQGKVDSAVAVAAVAVATSPSVTTRAFDRPYDTTHYAGLQRLRTTPPPSPADMEALPVRRVDRSGLLEIADTSRPRHMAGIDPGGHVMGTLSRRVDRSGLLEAVPEVVPSTEDGAIEGLDESFNPAGILHRRSPVALSAHGSSEDVGRLRSSLWTMEAPANVSLSPVPSPLRLPDYARLSPSGSDRGMRCRLEESRLCGEDRQEETCSYSSPPSLISRVRPSSSPIDPLSMHRDCGHGSSQGRLMSRATQPDLIESHDATRDRSMDKIDKASDDESARPEGERAEAEGCEHSSVEGLDERRGSFKTSNELLRNDNVQTLRVIILSEQL